MHRDLVTPENPEDPIDPSPTDWSVVVLTGGASTRMGTDKASLVVSGASLLERTLAGVPADVPVVVAGPIVDVSRDGVTFAQEEPAGGGPVSGLDAALPHTNTPHIVVLATDLPFAGDLPVQLATALQAADLEFDGVLALDRDGRRQQLCAAYRVAALESAIEAATAGTGVAGASMRSVVERLTVETLMPRSALDSTDPAWDVDTPDDLARLRALLDD